MAAGLEPKHLQKTRGKSRKAHSNITSILYNPNKHE